MRGTLLLAIIVLSIGASLQQAQQNLSDPTGICLNSTNRGPLNTVYPGLTLVDTPIRNTTFCANEFAVYGSCCNLDAFNRTIQAMRNSSQTNNTFLKTQYTSYINAIIQMRNFIIELANKPLDPSDAQQNAQRNAAAALLADPFMGPYLSNHNSSLATEFNTSMDACWPSAQRIRESALCIQCSGRAQFFQGDNSGLGHLTLNSSSCNYDQCKFAHQRIVAFIQDIDYLFNLLPSLYATLGINTNFGLVVNRARIAQYAERFDAETFFAMSQRADSGDSTARTQICTMFLSAGGPLLHETISTVFTRNRNFTVTSILSTISPLELSIVNAASTIANFSRNLSSSGFPFASVSNTSNPNGTYAMGNLTVNLPPQPPLRPIFRRRLQGVNNTFPGNLGRDIVNLTEYKDELARVGSLLSNTSARANQIRTNFIDPPSPFFSVAGTVIGANTLSLTGGRLTFVPESTTNALVAGRPFGVLVPYDRPSATSQPDYTTLRLSPFRRFSTPTDLVAVSP